MLTATHRVGRLVTIRITSPVSSAELQPFEADVQRIVQALPGSVTFCSDFRGAQVMNDEVTGRLIGIMRRNNAQLARTALLLPADGVVIGLQVERLIREAGSPSRKIFRTPQAAVLWLAEVLTPDEQMSLSAFLAEIT